MLSTSRDPYRDKTLYINCPILINQESIIPMKAETCWMFSWRLHMTRLKDYAWT